jgi:hypothetical protein
MAFLITASRFFYPGIPEMACDTIFPDEADLSSLYGRTNPIGRISKFMFDRGF